MAESGGTEEPLDEGEGGRERSGLKLSIKKNSDHGTQHHSFMANRRGTVEVVTDFPFLGSEITADGDCSHEIRLLFLGRKIMKDLDSVLKSRDITLPTKVCIVKAMVFPVVMYDCESWTVKKAERQKLMPSNCGAREDS